MLELYALVSIIFAFFIPVFYINLCPDTTFIEKPVILILLTLIFAILWPIFFIYFIYFSHKDNGRKVMNEAHKEEYYANKKTWNTRFSTEEVYISRSVLRAFDKIIEKLYYVPSDIIPTSRNSLQLEDDNSNGSYFEAEIYVDKINILIIPYYNYISNELSNIKVLDEISISESIDIDDIKEFNIIYKKFMNLEYDNPILVNNVIENEYKRLKKELDELKAVHKSNS